MNDTVEFLVSHGRAAALTRCRTPGDWRPERSDRVVLRSPRGLELGDVLGAADGSIDISALATGELLRRATPDDETLALSLNARCRSLLDEAHSRIESLQLPMLALDAELLLDGREAFLHVLRWGEGAVTPLVEGLRDQHGFFVRIVDHSHVDEADHGCSSCGGGGCGSCGEGGCGEEGCGSGSCSSGEFRNADDLTAYFLKLREEMLSHPRVPLL